MRSQLDEQLQKLNAALIEMGATIECAIERASKALVDRDVNLAREVIEFERKTDEMDRDIESLCLRLLLQQQPVARDLRLISAALKMITDMERIGDQAADIAEIVVMLKGAPYIKRLEHIPEMAKETIWMVKSSIDAFVSRNLTLAEQVITHDDVVDELFVYIKNELITLIEQRVDTGSQALDLLMIAKYLERIGDHAVNIAEWVAFAITGIHKGDRA
ncbi:MAG: phosphate signaling complex protein PhoU [Betaproteobacteria bacterium]|nr:phosphate signaling complex protein PhoU [Betaproteobacteria bacterium]